MIDPEDPLFRLRSFVYLFSLSVVSLASLLSLVVGDASWPEATLVLVGSMAIVAVCDIGATWSVRRDME